MDYKGLDITQLKSIEQECLLDYNKAKAKLDDIQKHIISVENNFKKTLELAEKYLYPFIGKIITFEDDECWNKIYIIKLTSCEETKCEATCQINLKYEKGFLYRRDSKSLFPLCNGDPSSVMLHRDHFNKVELFSESDIKSEIENYLIKVVDKFNEFTK